MANKRVLDRSAYSATTISTYELLAAYIVDIYYNHLYTEAILMKNSKTNPITSVTEGYKHSVLAFLTALDNKSKTYNARSYAQLLTGINQFFTTWTSFSTLTLSDCINKIVVEFIPSDYFSSLNKDQLRNILRVVLTDVIREFSKEVISNFLTGIIDNHKEPANITALKECMVDLLIMEREGFYNKFLSRSAGKKVETVDKAIATKMQQEIKRLHKERKSLTNSNNNLKKENAARVDQVRQVIHKYKLLLTKYKGVVDENNRLKQYQYEEPVHYNPPNRFIEPPESFTEPEPSNRFTELTKPEPEPESELESESFTELTKPEPESTPTKPKRRKKTKPKTSSDTSKRREEKAAAKQAAEEELARAELERDAAAKQEAEVKLASSLAEAAKQTAQTTDMGSAPTIGGIDDEY